MPGGRLRRWAGPAALVLSFMAGTAATATAQRIELVSRANPPKVTPAGPSSVGDLSADGRFVVFVSLADDLVPGQIDRRYIHDDFDPEGTSDVFLRDRATGKNTLVSHSVSSPVAGGPAGWSSNPAISADGRYVVFVSNRSDLVPGQDRFSSGSNVFLYDRLLNATRIVSHKYGAPQQQAASGATILTSPLISDDGRLVVYATDARGLLRDPDQNEIDRKVLLYDRLTGANTLVGAGTEPRMSTDGRFIVFHDDDFQIRLYDRSAGTATLVSHAAGSPEVPANDESAYPKISADGSTVVYQSWATDLVPGQVDTRRTDDLFLYDRVSGQTVLLSRSIASPVATGNKPSYEPALSSDGRWISFYSEATDLVPGVTDANGDYDVFLYDRISGSVRLVSRSNRSPAVAANDGSYAADISADGRKIAFLSLATDLAPIPSGSGGWSHLFFYDRDAGTPVLAGAMAGPGLPRIGVRIFPVTSADGSAAVFGSGFDLVTGDLNANWDVYLYGTEARPGGPNPFVPCTLLDTRSGGNGPALRPNVRRVLNASAACAVPATAQAVVVQVTVFQAPNKGTLRLYPGNVSNRPAGSLPFQKNGTHTESFVLPLATNGTGTLALLPVLKGNGTVHAAVEISGYYD